MGRLCKSQNYGWLCKFSQVAGAGAEMAWCRNEAMGDLCGQEVRSQPQKAAATENGHSKDGPGGGGRTHTVLSTTGF
jgi:hypothetical protein